MARNTQGQQGNEGSLCTSVVGRLGTRHAADVALAERNFARLHLHFLFQRIGSKSSQQGTAAGQDAQCRTQESTAQHSWRHVLEVFLGRHQARHLGGEHFALMFWLGQIADDLSVTEHTHGDHHKADTVGQFRNVKAETCDTGVHVGTHQAQQQTQHNHGHGLEQRTRCQHHGADQAQDHQGKVFGRTEFESQFGQWWCESSQNQRAHTTSEKRAQSGSSQRRSRSTFSGHLVTVNTGHHRGRFTRQIHQNGGGRTAVLRAVINTGQHDQRRHRRQGVGSRQQHGNRGHRTHPGKTPIRVPSTQPASAYNRLMGVKATPKPSDKCSISSIIFP